MCDLQLLSVEVLSCQPPPTYELQGQVHAQVIILVTAMFGSCACRATNTGGIQLKAL